MILTGATNPFLRILEKRSRHMAPLAKLLTGSVTFNPGTGRTVTLHIRKGRAVLEVDCKNKVDTVIHSDPTTMARVMAGRSSGIEAFVNGKLRVRGNLALALKLESIFEFPGRPAHAAQAAFAEAAGINTFYLEAGKGPVVILLHGLGGTNASMLPTFQALSKRYRVIAPDNPGFGESGKPLRSYDPAFFVDWLRSFLDTLGIKTASFIGNSMGGRIAIEMALRHPERVEKLVLFAPSMAFRRFRQIVPLVQLLAPQLAVFPIPLPRQQIVTTLKSMFSKPKRVEQAWYDAAVDEFLRVFRSPRARIAFFSAAKQIYLESPYGQTGFWERLPAMEPPALFVWGGKDWLVPAKFARHAESALPHARSLLLKDCGHVPQFELPHETHRAVLRFLRESKSQRRVVGTKTRLF
jgi:pimeloyl-ACP methyl ester carboxylesterase/putative sterol carrier protein